MIQVIDLLVDTLLVKRGAFYARTKDVGIKKTLRFGLGIYYTYSTP